MSEQDAAASRPLALPTIHLNGTPASRLLEDVLRACDSLRTAIANIERAAPNARDYCTQDAGAFWRAVEEHKVRLLQLAGVLRDLEALAEHISNSASV